MTKPVCAYCKKAYGVRYIHTENIFCISNPDTPDQIPMAEPYKGNGQVLKERYSPDEAGWKRGDRSISATSFIGYGVKTDGPVGRTLYRTVWIPGEYYDSYSPFCKLRCALKFARASFTAGYRIKD